MEEAVAFPLLWLAWMGAGFRPPSEEPPLAVLWASKESPRIDFAPGRTVIVPEAEVIGPEPRRELPRPPVDSVGGAEWTGSAAATERRRRARIFIVWKVRIFPTLQVREEAAV